LVPHDLSGVSPAAIQVLHDEAFDVEKVTKKFFETYRSIFEQAEASISLGWSVEQKRLYTQRFFNRLMFLAFLERKGWLVFGGKRDYLRALFEDYWRNDPEKRREANFHRKRLDTLFFMGLNNSYGHNLLQSDPHYKILRDLIGEVPFLNGGLFEREDDEQEGSVTWFFPDPIIAKILNELVYAFNFTVTESTPLDVEVAVDPEMLGKIFEELVTGRHESGSYYTVKPVVAFMCYEALAGYLRSRLPSESEAAIIQFVYQKDPSQLRDPEAVLEALRAVKVCDLACGSGAYLLGMLHVLLELRECLFVTRSLDPKTVYERKLEIIQNNLYGVDIDPFAVNIARLRLWLSLIVDFEGETPPPLPNLKYKIETGDSLTAPDPSGHEQVDMFRLQKIKEFAALKAEHLNSHSGKKKDLEKKIETLRAEISAWSHPIGTEGFDWAVEFAEVFMPELSETTMTGAMAGIMNAAGGQMELTSTSREGGFDIVLANPPYVRQELISDQKPVLKRVYGDLYTGTADLYVYFYLRAHQLLRPGGVACFISSNKWLRAGYGETLRRHLLDEQAFTLVVDFGELPVFQTASTFPAIFVWRKEKRGEIPTKWAVVKNLQECYDEGIVEHVTRIAQTLPASQFGKGKSRLSSARDTDKRSQMESRGIPLGVLIQNQVFFGIKTGCNEAFIIDRITYDELIKQDATNERILKPLLAGDDVRRFEIHFRDTFLVWTYIGVPIQDYPAIFEHLKKYKKQASERQDQGKHWWELRSCDYYDRFEKPKIIYPQIMMQGRFYLDKNKVFTNQKCFIISTDDYYLLGILNSRPIWNYLQSKVVTFGDPNENGRLEPRREDILGLPIPDAQQSEREEVARLAQETQNLHTQRRRRVEQFLRAIGIDPAQSNSRNPLEAPWELSKENFGRRAKSAPLALYTSAREETTALTEEIVKIEAEIDERVRSLYGVE
jgi:methylase of polypeptide subunit release factors